MFGKPFYYLNVVAFVLDMTGIIIYSLKRPTSKKCLQLINNKNEKPINISYTDQLSEFDFEITNSEINQSKLLQGFG